MTTHVSPPVRPFALVFLSIVLGACGGGFHQQVPRSADASEEPAVDDGEVQRALATRPQLPAPYRVGVFFRAPESDTGEPEWRWRPEDRDRLLSIATQLGADVSALFPISPVTVTGDDFRSIRIAAARHGADAVLIVTGRDSREQHLNGWAVTYAALLPLLFVPGSELSLRFETHAELWDVRNGYLYLAADAEAEETQTRAPALLDPEQALSQSRKRATEALAQELARHFRALHGGA